MITSRILPLGLAAIFLAAPSLASAKCTRNGDLICGKGTSTIASSGPLQVSSGGDFSPVGSGVALQNGDRVLVGAGEAKLALGSSCQAAVGPGSLVTIEKNGAQTCASVTEQAAQAGVVPPAGGVNPVLLGAGALVGAGAIAAAVVLSDNGNGGSAPAPGSVSSR